MVGQQEAARNLDEEVGWHEEEARQDAATMIDEHIACAFDKHSLMENHFLCLFLGLMVLRHGMGLEYYTESQAAHEALIAITFELHNSNPLTLLMSMSNLVV
jgi:hypothetical protein